MLSQTVEYALRAVVYLAAEAPESRTTSQISAATQTPSAYLSKVLQALSKEGLVRSQRGAGGGVCLEARPEELTILDVVNAVDPIERISSCPLGLASHGVRLCPLHRRMDDALGHVEAAFRATTLAEVLADPTQPTPLCETPAALNEGAGSADPA